MIAAAGRLTLINAIPQPLAQNSSRIKVEG